MARDSHRHASVAPDRPGVYFCSTSLDVDLRREQFHHRSYGRRTLDRNPATGRSGVNLFRNRGGGRRNPMGFSYGGSRRRRHPLDVGRHGQHRRHHAEHSRLVAAARR